MANPTYGAIKATAPIDGVIYASSKIIPATEADLNNVSGATVYDPAAVLWGRRVCSVVSIAISGGPATTTLYVVLQTDAGDDNWFDCAWLTSTATAGTVNTVLWAGASGTAAGSYAMSRSSGSSPSGTNYYNGPLIGRFRWVGQATFTGGTSPKATCSIKYKLEGMR